MMKRPLWLQVHLGGIEELLSSPIGTSHYVHALVL